MNPLLSIIIATKNRQKYALNAVESILSLKDERIEVVVQDNSDTNVLASQLSKFNLDTRFVYNYTNELYSFVDNFNASIELANGEYLCMIGDDDGINPEIIEATQWAKNNDVDALVGSLSANYRWEGTGAPDTFFTKMTGSTLTITHFTGKAQIINIEESLSRLMKNGCTNYLDFFFPKLYHGVVKSKCLNDIKQKTGAFIQGLSPDIYSSIALACVINKLVSIDYPLTIPGVCAESGSIKEGQIKNHSKRLEDAPHFKGRDSYIWSENVPRIYCVQAIWADSAFAALKNLKHNDITIKFNKYMLYANIISADYSLKGEVIKLIKDESKTPFFNYISLVVAYIKGPLKKFVLKRAYGRFKIIFGINRLFIFNNISDIHKATHALIKFIKQRSISYYKELNKIC